MLRYVAHAGSKVLDSSDPSASASQVTETIGACLNNLARNYWTLDRVYGHQMPQFVELTFRIETDCLVRICFYRKGGKCDPQICWRVTWLHENYRWNLQRDAVNPGIESSKKSSRFPFLSADCPEEPRTCLRKSQVNSEHCLNAPLLRWGTTGQFTASFTRFLHKLSRGGIQRRADTGPCGFGIEWKAHRVFRLFLLPLSSLPDKGQAPWILPAEFRQKVLGFKSSPVPGPWSQGKEWGIRAGYLRTPVLGPPGFLSTSQDSSYCRAAPALPLPHGVLTGAAS